MRRARVDRWIAVGIFTGVLVVTALFSRAQGVHRDEAYYMDAGEQYIGWYERLIKLDLEKPASDATVRKWWGYNHEHPPLMKTLYGLSWRLFHACDCAREARWHAGANVLREGKHVTIPLFSETLAFRLPTMIAFALLCALVYLWFVEAFGGRAGAVAAALLMAAQPRAFFHAQTAAFDLPAATLWFACAFAYWRTLVVWRPVKTVLVVGVLYGLFLSTKLQSFFLPFALIAHWVGVVVLRAIKKEATPFPSPWSFLGLVTVAPLVFFALWPWLWHDTIDRFGGYLGFHLNHVHYNFEYFGTNYNRPPYPWHEPLGMLVTTAPVILLVLALLGAVMLGRLGWRSWKGAEESDPRRTGLLWLIAGLVPVAPFFLGSTPIFGETKHWLATMPFLALAGGVAVHVLHRRLVAELALGARGQRLAAAALIAIAFVPAAVETVRSHPYGLSHYNALAGGAPGGADLGMNRQFWGYSVRGLLPWFNQNLPQGSKIYLHDWNHDSYEIYLRDGLLRPDLKDAGMEISGVRSSDTALVIHERHFNKYEYMIWEVYGTVRPVKVLTLDGVPLVTVYRR